MGMSSVRLAEGTVYIDGLSIRDAVLADLVSRQTDAVVFFHGFDHVIDKFLHLRRL